MQGLFMRIVKGEIPAHKVLENDLVLAFLDIFPLAPGHTLVIPKVEVDSVYDLDGEHYQALWDMTRNIAPAIKKAFPCLKVGIAVIGLEVPHAHVHLVPLQNVADLNFARHKLKPDQAELEHNAGLIRSFL
ncbi:MAG: HIT domain-containing protein [Cytophagia bacterium]|nr:HIT domain-containing protein [Cytophagia bacterium]